MIRVKRVYDEPGTEDGYRILVDRLWPRGLSKEKARIDLWVREIAPSDELRKWFSHDPKKWGTFKTRYANELADKQQMLDKIRGIERENGTGTLLYSTKEERYNNAVALSSALKVRKAS